jgi:hypothetical protein
MEQKGASSHIALTILPRHRWSAHSGPGSGLVRAKGTAIAAMPGDRTQAVARMVHHCATWAAIW